MTKRILEINSVTDLGQSFDSDRAEELEMFLNEKGWDLGDSLAICTYVVAMGCAQHDDIEVRSYQIKEAITLMREIWEAKMRLDFAN